MQAVMMRYVFSHLYLSVGGKIMVAGLGGVCCSPRSIRTGTARRKECPMPVLCGCNFSNALLCDVVGDFAGCAG